MDEVGNRSADRRSVLFTRGNRITIITTITVIITMTMDRKEIFTHTLHIFFFSLSLLFISYTVATIRDCFQPLKREIVPFDDGYFPETCVSFCSFVFCYGVEEEEAEE